MYLFFILICCPHRQKQRRGAQQRQQSGLVVGVSDREHGLGLGLGLHPDTYALKGGGPHDTRALRPKRCARVRLHARDVPHEKEQKAICVAIAQKRSEVSAEVCFEIKSRPDADF